jgi:hypothetical protein
MTDRSITWRNVPASPFEVEWIDSDGCAASVRDYNNLQQIHSTVDVCLSMGFAITYIGPVRPITQKG